MSWLVWLESHATPGKIVNSAPKICAFILKCLQMFIFTVRYSTYAL